MAMLNLVTSTKDPKIIQKLSNQLPSLNGELKMAALELILTLTSQEDVFHTLTIIINNMLKQ